MRQLEGRNVGLLWFQVEGNLRLMIAAADIKAMSLVERLQAMEMLWRSLTDSPENVESPAWHGDVLASRLAEVEAGKGEFLTISQLKARLNAKRS